jgi:hypothetical protein
MEALLRLLDQYGIPLVLMGLVLINLKNIATFVRSVAERLLPSWAEKQALGAQARQDKIEELSHRRNRRETERLDTILTLKDTLLAYREELDRVRAEYREELDDAKRERRDLQRALYDFIAKYERLAAQNIEVLRDLSDLVRTVLDNQRNERLNIEKSA